MFIYHGMKGTNLATILWVLVLQVYIESVADVGVIIVFTIDLKGQLVLLCNHVIGPLLSPIVTIPRSSCDTLFMQPKLFTYFNFMVC